MDRPANFDIRRKDATTDAGTPDLAELYKQRGYIRPDGGSMYQPLRQVRLHTAIDILNHPDAGQAKVAKSKAH
jgi:hypothetical protein